MTKKRITEEYIFLIFTYLSHKDMMKRSLFLLVILTVISCNEINENATREKLEQTLQSFNKAFETANVEMLKLMISENYTHTNGSWKSFGKENWLGFMKSRKMRIENGELQINSYEMKELRIEMYELSAFVTGKIVMQGIENGVDFEKEIRISNFWVIENGEWKRAGFHDTRIES